jgi:acetylornithine deacetylase
MNEMQKYIDLLLELIAIPSESRNERAAADYLEAWLKSEGLPTYRKGNNLWCVDDYPTDDERPLLMLNAHIDTVKPAAGYTRNPYQATLENGRIYGLGSNDDGGSLVSLLSAYEELRQSRQPYRLLFTATAEEEVSGAGGLDMILEDIGKVDFGIIGEPTNMQMAVAEKGLMVLDCTAHGRSGHAARNEGENALYKAMDDIRWFKDYRFERVSQFLGEVKMSVTQIEAGRQHNVVPDICKFVVDIRPNGLYSNTELLEYIKSQVKSDVKARSTRLNSSHIDMNHPAVVRGKSLGLSHFGSPTMSNQAVTPFTTLKIGPGDSARSHTADEYICISEIVESRDIFIRLLNQLNI